LRTLAKTEGRLSASGMAEAPLLDGDGDAFPEGGEAYPAHLGVL
jgi:hypothetical protein